MTLDVNILILNYNGEALLKEYLPSFQKAVARSTFPCRLGVIDNRSQDQSVEFIKKYYHRRQPDMHKRVIKKAPSKELDENKEILIEELQQAGLPPRFMEIRWGEIWCEAGPEKNDLSQTDG